MLSNSYKKIQNKKRLVKITRSKIQP